MSRMRGWRGRFGLLVTIGWLGFAFEAVADEERFEPRKGGAVLDHATGLSWQSEDDGVSRSWKDALAYCEDLALAGHHDWRLPNVKELRSIVDTARSSPAVNTEFFPNASSGGYWSSSTRASSPNFAWYVIFSRGQVYTNIKTNNAHVRCVR